MQRVLLRASLVLAVVISPLTTFAQNPANTPPCFTSQDATSTQRYKISATVLGDLSQDNLDDTRKYFATAVSDSLSNAQLRAVWSGTTGLLASYLSIGYQCQRGVQGTTLYITQAKFQKGNAELRISFDSANAIVSIWLITVGDHPARDLEASARSVVDQMRLGQYQAVYDRFAQPVKATGNVGAISSSWRNLVANKGAFVQQLAAQKSSEADVVDVLCKFAGGNAVIRVGFSPSLELTLVTFLPAQ